MKIIYIEKGYSGREVTTCVNFCNQNDDYQVLFISDILGMKREPVFIVGSVEFVESIKGKKIPNYYPEWTQKHRFRLIRYYQKIPKGIYYLNLIPTEKSFIKPADQYKKFDGFVGFAEEVIKERGKFPYYFSEVVNFVDEWRYYISNGKVLCSWWYQGNEQTCEDNPHGPKLDMDIPEDFSGTIDMGYLSTGEFALVECHHPYAIGWYGEVSEGKDYIEFMEEGFRTL